MEEKPERENGIRITYIKNSAQTDFHVGSFPLSQFKKWNQDCKENFGDCRWAKMMSDHEKAQMYDMMVMREHESVQEEEATEEKKKTISLIGGGELEEE